MKRIILIIILFTFTGFSQNYIIRQDSLRASEAATKLNLRNAIKDSLDANTRGFQKKPDVISQIDSSLNANPKGWQTKPNVISQIDSSLNANPKGWRNSQQAKQDAVDTLKVITIISSEPSGTSYAIVQQGGELRRVALTNLPLQTIAQQQFQALLDSIANLRASIGGVAPTNPLPVTNLQAVAGDGVVNLTWTNPSLRDSIVIERTSSLGPANFSRLASVDTNYYNDSSVTNSVIYTYRLRVYYQKFASSPVEVSATPQAPARSFYFTIYPTSINFNNLGGGGRESGIVGDAEDGNISFFDSTYQNPGTITASQVAKINGNYGYRFSWNGTQASGLMFARKSISNTDSVNIRFNVKVPANYPLVDTTVLVTYDILRFYSSPSTSSILVGSLLVRVRNNAFYLYRVGVRNGGTTFNYTLPTSTYNFKVDSAVIIEYRLVKGAGNGRVTVLWNNNVIYDTTGLTNNDYNASYAFLGSFTGNYVYNDRHIYIDNIKISSQPIGLYSASSNQAIVTVRNDSSFAMDYTALTTSPFNIQVGNVYDRPLASGDSVQIVLQIDTTGLASGNHSRNLEIINDYNTQTVNLSFFKSPTSIDSIEGSRGWFVNKNATGLNNGTSWDNAWTSFSSISWNSMQVGDTLYISGGSDSLVYSESMTPTKKGITITKGKSTGHNGRVIIKAPTVASGIGINVSSVDSIRIVRLEFQDWFTCVRFYSNVTNGITFGMMKDCKGRTAGWVTEGLNNSGALSDTANLRVKNLWYINNDFTTVNNSSYQTEFGSFGAVANVFFIGNKFINYNNNSATHDDFVQGNYNTNFYYINNFFRHDSSVTKEGNANGLAGISNGGGDWYFINNILVEPPTSINYPIMMFYRPLTGTLYPRNWARIRIINNTLVAAHPSAIRYGYDAQGYIVNNIMYCSPERILISSSGAGRSTHFDVDGASPYYCQTDISAMTFRNNMIYNNYTDAANPNGKTIPIFDTECSPQPSDTVGNIKLNRTSSVLYTPFASVYTTNNNPSWFSLPSGSSAIDKGITVTGLTMHSSVTSIIDPEYGTPLSNYRGSGKNLVQYFVERDFYGNLRTGTWDAGAINGN